MSNDDLVWLGMGIVAVPITLFYIVYAIAYGWWKHKRGERAQGEWVPVETEDGVVLVNIADPNVMHAVSSMVDVSEDDIPSGPSRSLDQHDDSIEEFEVRTAGTPSWELLDGPPR